MKKQNTKTAQPEESVTGSAATNPFYSKAELKEFRSLILHRMEEARTNHDLLQGALLRHTRDTEGSSPTFKLSEDAIDVFTKEDIARYAIRLGKFIDQLRYAMARVEAGTYGVCALSGKLISKSRLSSFPQTILSAEAKKELIRMMNITS
jgi:DnaK suppressor protein